MTIVDGQSCPMCGRTYGMPIPDQPDRCGVCLTGISLDGRPVFPQKAPDGRYVSPITGGELLRLPGDVWCFDLTETARELGLDPSPEAEYARSVRSRLKDWPGYAALIADPA